MKLFYKIIVALLVSVFVVSCFAACNNSGADKDTEAKTETESNTEAVSEPDDEEPEFIDYAAQVKFNKNSGRAWAEVKVHEEKNGDRIVYGYVDGDTTHFDVPNDVQKVIGTDVLKARYLGINTPESTGEIEPWGKKASNYTRAALEGAESIIIESDTATWNADSTGSRYTVWVWYKTAEMSDYRNLNIEILQSGLAFGSNAASNSYSTYTMGALNQAKSLKLYVFSSAKDPDFYYGGAYEVSLKELKTNPEKYSGKLVAFDGVVAKSVGSTIYMEEHDTEAGIYFGIQVFCGYNLPGSIIDLMKIGNRIHMVGTLQYYETGGYYQISNVQYDILDPNSPKYIHVLEEGYAPGYTEIDPELLIDGTCDIEIITEDEDGNETSEIKSFKYGELAQFSTATLNDLTIKKVYTTKDGSSEGAISITCETAGGKEIVVRTSVLLDADGNRITEDQFTIGAVINARGIIDCYGGKYQLKVFSFADVTFQ